MSMNIFKSQGHHDTKSPVRNKRNYSGDMVSL